MNRIFRATCLLLLLIPPPVIALDDVELARLLQTELVQRDLPGVRAAVRFADGRLLRAVAGMADREAGVPLDSDIGMPGGSTGKTFVAALAMLLVEEGVLSLDDPARKWLGGHAWFRALSHSEQIRVRHLLSHSAGLGDYPARIGFLLRMVVRVLRFDSAYFAPEELIALSGAGGKFVPGTGFAYTDAGYLALGRLIEAATGTGYYELLEERILRPQGLSRVRPQNEAVLRDISAGYQGGARNLRADGSMKLDPRTEWTGGGLVTTPEMLVQFHAALAAGRVVTPASLAAMLEGGWRDPGEPGYHYGFGLFVDDGGDWFGHGGKWAGYRTQVRHYRRSGLTVAVQTNTDDRVGLLELLTRVADAARAVP